jgi:hypothetical protein
LVAAIAIAERYSDHSGSRFLLFERTRERFELIEKPLGNGRIRVEQKDPFAARQPAALVGGTSETGIAIELFERDALQPAKASQYGIRGRIVIDDDHIGSSSIDDVGVEKLPGNAIGISPLTEVDDDDREVRLG